MIQHGPESPAFNGLLGQIVIDVTAGVTDTPNVPQEWLIAGLTKRLGEELDATRAGFSPTGKYYKAMEVMLGANFTKQSLVEQFRTIEEFYASPKEDRESRVLAGLSRLYAVYQAANSGDPQHTWQDFVEAHQLFRASGGARYPFHLGHIPYYEPEVYFNLPSLKGDGSLREEPWQLGRQEALTNTCLQVNLARSTGVLSGKENWFRFIQRGTIKRVSSFYKRQPSDEGLILGELPEDSSSLDMPTDYYGIPTKYSGVEANVFFDDSDDTSREYKGKLDKLITDGELTPRIVLSVPTRYFLPID